MTQNWFAAGKNHKWTISWNKHPTLALIWFLKLKMQRLLAEDA